MSDLLRLVQNALVEHKLLAGEEPLVVAVSGGLDSMVLLHVLHTLRHGPKTRLVIAHFNHQLRGRSSDADEGLVRRRCATLGLRVEVGREPIRLVAERMGVSIEMAARERRHQFLAGVARELRIEKVALAHHADDQVELFFLRLLRGAGPEGLVGMKWTSPSPAGEGIRLIRPLLATTRTALEAYAREQHIPFREDATNAQLEYERNRIRHKLLPFLREQFQPALNNNLRRLMDILAAESDFVADATAKAQRAGKPGFDGLPLAIQRRWLRSACRAAGIDPDFELIESLRQEARREVMVSPRLVLSRDVRGELRSRKVEAAEFKPDDKLLDLESSDEDALFGGKEFSWRIRPWKGWAGRARQGRLGKELFDADKVGGRIRLRHWRPGDRFQPIGLDRSVKVQDLFTNAHIPRERRTELVVAESVSGEIFWIEGLRISERFKIDERTRRALVWSWRVFG